MYWFSFPAIMKGWIDRVLTKGYAYSEGKRYSQGVFKVMLASSVTIVQVQKLNSPSHTGQEGHSLLHHWVPRVDVYLKWH